jgi:hypothetical protein
MRRALLLVLFAACASSTGNGNGGNGSNDGGNGDGNNNNNGDGNNVGSDEGCDGVANCYSVYAHSDDTLYLIDLGTKTLQTIGPFDAPKVNNETDVITDLAVAPDATIWAISNTELYTADATDGHVTSKGSLGACGTRGVALTFTPDGKLYTGDFSGAVCQIDLSGATPMVEAAVTVGSGYALSGDIVAVGDGTVFGTLYKLSDDSNHGTQLNNVLGKVNLTTGAVTVIGATGYPKLFGVSFANGMVIGFTHDGTGHVAQIDVNSGSGSLFATFTDPTSHQGISFAGAGVNALVPIIQ